MLRRLIGHRVDADPDAAATLATQCAHLPLALRVAAELAVARPTTPLAELVIELADQQHRLDLLDADGDPRAAVTAVFSWSMRHLPVDAARTFRLLGLHPGPDIDAYATAALTDTSLSQARLALDRLARAHLVHPTGPARYGMHDLLRAYATTLTTAHDSDADRRAASTRLFDYYLVTAAAATQQLRLVDAHGRPGTAAPATTPTPELAGPGTALRWLDTERPCLVAAAAHTATHGWPAHAVRLSMTLYRYLEGGHYIDALTIHAHARDAARQAGDPAGQAHAQLGLGTINVRLGRLELATEHLVQASVLFRQAGDLIGQARVLTNLGVVEDHRGHYQAAADRLEQALALYQQTCHTIGEAMALHNLGVAEDHLGRHQAAADRLEQALVRYRRLGYPREEAMTLHNLGLAAMGLGRYQEAADRQEQALALIRQLGYPRGEAWALYGLGSVQTRLGRPDQAIALHTQALTLFRESGERGGEIRALNGLGEATLAAGRPADALTHHTAALSTSVIPDQQARAHTGADRAHHILGDLVRARHHYEHALALHTRLGSPDAHDVGACLIALDASPDTGHDQHD
ncbi:tetratricopeptide repeat protein [Dactylosporangium cerinum]